MDLIQHLKKSKSQERYPDVFTEVSRKSHRPQKRFIVEIKNKEDARKATGSDIPILWIDSSYTKMLRYPMTIPDTIVVPREFKDVIKTGLNLHTFESTTPFRDTVVPRLEDVVIFMLTLDPLAARGMVDRSDLDLTYLQKRIFQEELVQEASEVHLQDLVDIPVTGEPLDKDPLMKIIDRNQVMEVVP